MKPVLSWLSASFILPIISLAFFLLSCKKEIKTGLQKSDALMTQANTPEQAYPGLHGEVLTTKFENKTIYVEKKGDRYVWMGDIAFDKKTFDSLKRNENATSERTYKPTLSWQWPDGHVFYSIQSGFSSAEQTMIMDAINHWQNNSGLTFTQRTNQPNYITFIHGSSGSGFSSDYVGMHGGVQGINLESGFITGNAIHEMGHAIGFYHEQSRSDRDNAIIINWNNVESGKENNFRTYIETNDPGAQIGVFDFGSVMLYGSFAFSWNGLPTITRLDGSTFIGQRVGLSAGDIETSNLIYGPPFARLREEVVSSYDNGSSTEVIQNVFLEFFSDAQCTQPVNLNVDRTMHVRHFGQIFDNHYGQNYWETNIDQIVTLNLTSGSHTYAVGQIRSYGEYDYSYSTIYSEYDTYLPSEANFR